MSVKRAEIWIPVTQRDLDDWKYLQERIAAHTRLVLKVWELLETRGSLRVTEAARVLDSEPWIIKRILSDAVLGGRVSRKRNDIGRGRPYVYTLLTSFVRQVFAENFGPAQARELIDRTIDEELGRVFSDDRE